ncbi:S8 family serine peptidase [soil metagenome]
MAACRLVLILSILSFSVQAQDNRYIVFFKDKNSNPYSIGQPEQFLSARAIARRSHSGVTINKDDLPVTPSYVSQIKSTGAKTFFTSRWMNAVLVEASPTVIDMIALLPTVLRTELVAPGTRLLGGRQKQLKQKNVTTSDEATQTQLQMLGLDTMQSDGFIGDGVLVSILDGGFPGVNTAGSFQSIFLDNRMKLTKDYVTNSGNVYQFDKHGTEVFSVIAAQSIGSFTGGAFKSSYMLFVTEDVTSEYRIEEYNWLFAAEKADSAGTDIIQSSLGYSEFDDSSMDYTAANLDGNTAVVSRAAAFARDRGIIVVVSAGNEGNKSWKFITPPADVDGILAAGAVNSSGQIVGFSSIGPTADGRIKPDVVALGQGTRVILPNGSLGTESGTSLAAPLITSLAAGLIQAYPELSPVEIVQAIRLSANRSDRPSNQYGYGLPNYIAVKNYLESNKSGDEVFIYPNPSSTVLSLAFKNLPEGEIDLSFFDSQGKALSNPALSLSWLNNPLNISLSNLAPGSYLLKVKTTTMVKTFRFVKL